MAKLSLILFLAIDIPLYKLRNPQMKAFFYYMGHPLPSETTLRKGFQEIYEDKIVEIKIVLKDKPIFLIIDETSDKGKSYTNILMGSFHRPYKSYLLCCDIRTQPVNSSYIYDLINKLLNDYEIRG